MHRVNGRRASHQVQLFLSRWFESLRHRFLWYSQLRTEVATLLKGNVIHFRVYLCGEKYQCYQGNEGRSGHGQTGCMESCDIIFVLRSLWLVEGVCVRVLTWEELCVRGDLVRRFAKLAAVFFSLFCVSSLWSFWPSWVVDMYKLQTLNWGLFKPEYIYYSYYALCQQQIRDVCRFDME